MRPYEPFLPRSRYQSRRLRRTTLKGSNELVRYSMCIIGFILSTACVYSTLNLHSEKNLDNGLLYGDLGKKVTIFSAPRPMVSSKESDLTWTRQKLAVRSWLALSGNVDVVLLGKHSSIVELKDVFGSRVTIEPEIDFTFLGTPFFHSVVARAQATSSDISMLIDSETILLPEILNALTSIQNLSKDWFVFSFTPTILNLKHQLTGSGHNWFRQEQDRKIRMKKLQEVLLKQSEERSCGERLLMAWNNPKFPLFHGMMPPFLYGKDFHDLWLVNEILSSEIRTVFDASDLSFSFYPESLDINSSKFPKDHIIGVNGTWEYHNNLHLATFYGSLYFCKSFLQNAPYKILKSSGQFYFLKEEKDHIQSQGTQRKKNLLTLSAYHREKIKCSLRQFDNLTMEPAQIEYTYTLERLLQIVADKDKLVILGISGESYRDMLMSWVCRLRYLGITNFLVYALDAETYEFSILQGLPVFMDTHSPRNISFDDCHFGTECFQRVTKVKSRMVLTILKLGYNVLLSDVDVYWFQNPLPYLSSFGPGVLMAQSDEFNETVPINLPRRLNSGFYFARSDPITIAAIELVVKHASSSNLSEQPSFYDVLCGEGGSNRVDDDKCFEPRTNLTVLFLDRDLFPNGAYKEIWNKRNIRSACMNLGCYVLHNNWINGRKRKLKRQMASGLWDYDPTLRLCVQNWSNAEILSDY